MFSHSPSTKFVVISFIVSIALHAVIVAGLFLIKPRTEIPSFTPVNIVNLPPQELKQLPPTQRPTPIPQPPVPRIPPPTAPQRIIPEKPLPPSAVPMPKKFGTGEEV